MWKALALVVFAAATTASAMHVFFPRSVLAQHAPMPGMPHGASQGHVAPMAGAPTLPGQQAFGTIAEVVKLLDADPQTDWTTVDLERLRQHLVDMDEVVMRAIVKQVSVPGGLTMDVTGTGRTEQAIQAMVVPHARELDAMPAYAARAERIPGGIRLTVTAKGAEDAKVVSRLRGLGFAGLLTEGSHHPAHHLAMARGTHP